MQDNWLVPFKGRNLSGAYEQNFLWQDNTIYIMDNHRAALWCWLQNIDENGKYNFFHMDRHFDTRTGRLEEWIANLPNLWTTDIQDYLKLEYNFEGSVPGIDTVPIISYDNYLSIFTECFGELIESYRFATHNEGAKPRISRNCIYVSLWEVPNNLEYWLSRDATNNDYPWIFNLDLDYFFCDYQSSRVLMLSDPIIDTIFEVIAKSYQEGLISVLTIALSPEYCGNWAAAEKLCSRICGKIGIDFQLPN